MKWESTEVRGRKSDSDTLQESKCKKKRGRPEVLGLGTLKFWVAGNKGHPRSSAATGSLEVLMLLEDQEFWLLRESGSYDASGNLEVQVLLEG